MPTITFTISSENLTRILNAFEEIYNIPLMLDPESPNEPVWIPQYTKAEWARLKLKEFVINTVLEYERRDASKDVEPDEDVVEVT